MPYSLDFHAFSISICLTISTKKFQSISAFCRLNALKQCSLLLEVQHSILRMGLLCTVAAAGEADCRGGQLSMVIRHYPTYFLNCTLLVYVTCTFGKNVINLLMTRYFFTRTSTFIINYCNKTWGDLRRWNLLRLA